MLLILGIFFTAMLVPSYAETAVLISPIAVIPLQSLPGGKELPWMSQAIADTITTKLSKIRGLKVLERTQVEAALEELALALTGIVDKDKAAEVGKFLGAQGIIIGNYIVTEDDFLRITVKLIDVESSEILQSEQVTSEVRNAGDIFRSIDEITLELLEAMGYQPTGKEKQEITVVPTESIAALQAKTEAQTALNKGEEEEALELAIQALKEDPGYQEAKEIKSHILSRQGRWFFNSSIVGFTGGLKTPWNPASLVNTYGSSVMGFAADHALASVHMTYYSLSFTSIFAGVYFGFNYVNYRLGDIEMFDEWGNFIGMTEHLADGVAISIAFQLSTQFSIGGSFKHVRERLADQTGTLNSFDIGLEFASGGVVADILARDLPSLRKTWTTGVTDVFPSALEGLLRIRVLKNMYLQGEIEHTFPLEPSPGKGVGGFHGTRWKAGLLFFTLPSLGVKVGITSSSKIRGYLLGGIIRLGNLNGGIDIETAPAQNFYSLGYTVISGYISVTF